MMPCDICNSYLPYLIICFAILPVSPQSIDDICDAVGGSELVTFASMSETFDEETTSIDSCADPKSVSYPTDAELITAAKDVAEALLVAPPRAPLNSELNVGPVSFEWPFNVRIGLNSFIRYNDYTTFPDYAGSDTPIFFPKELTDMMVSYVSNMTAFNVAACLGSQGTKDCSPYPAEANFESTVFTVQDSHDGNFYFDGKVSIKQSTDGRVTTIDATFQVRKVGYGITKTKSVSYDNIEIDPEDPDAKCPILDFNCQPKQRFLPTNQNFKDAMISAIRNRLELFALGEIAGCLAKECRLDNKGSMYCIIIFRCMEIYVEKAEVFRGCLNVMLTLLAMALPSMFYPSFNLQISQVGLKACQDMVDCTDKIWKAGRAGEKSTPSTPNKYPFAPKDQQSQDKVTAIQDAQWNLNLAQGKTTFASSEASPNSTSRCCDPYYAVDGKDDTYWRSLPDANGTAWIVVDLGDVYSLGEMGITFEGAPSQVNLQAQNTSTFMSNTTLWSKAVSFPQPNDNATISHNFNGLSGRYVGILVSDSDPIDVYAIVITKDGVDGVDIVQGMSATASSGGESAELAIDSGASSKSKW